MNSDSKIISRATDPNQYDMDDTAWESTIGLESPMRIFIWEFLKKYAQDWKGKSFLDIGAGSGWLLEEARKIGAIKTAGVEPSKKNFKMSQKLFPLIEMVNLPFEEFNSNYKFDVIISILALSHIIDIEGTFKKISSLLSLGGQLIIISMDYDYYKLPRLGYEIRTEDIDEDTYAINLKGQYGTLSDIVRKTEIYLQKAKAVNLEHVETVPMKPTKELMEAMPQLKEVEGQTFFNLFIFRNVQ